MSTLTIIRGIPGSGKSTLARYLIRTMKNAAHFEADMFFMDDDGNYNFDGTKLREAHAWCQESTRNVLRNGFSVIVSNTFTQLKELETYFAIAHDLELEMPQVILCQGNFGSIHNVPDYVLENMRKRFEYDITPLIRKYNFIWNGKP